MTIDADPAQPRCSCRRTPSGKVEVVPFGADLELRELRRRGPAGWWSWAGVCDHCGQHWLVERMYDVNLLRKLSDAEAAVLHEQDAWPADFDRDAAVIEIGKVRGQVVRFHDPVDSSLVEIVRDLLVERPDLDRVAVAALLDLTEADAAAVLRRAADPAA